MQRLKKIVTCLFFGLLIFIIGLFHTVIRKGKDPRQLIADVVELGRRASYDKLNLHGDLLDESNFGLIEIFDLELKARSIETKIPIKSLIKQYVDELKLNDVPSYSQSFPTFGFGGSVVKDVVHCMVAMRSPVSGVTSAFISEVPVDQVKSLLLNYDPLNDDLPGKDLADVPRFPGSRRMFYLRKDFGKSEETLLVYENRAPLSSNINYYKSRMAGGGWTSNEIMEEASAKQGPLPEQTLLFNKDNKQCIMTISKDELQKSIVSLLHRKAN